jgi:hypothetical protein
MKLININKKKLNLKMFIFIYYILYNMEHLEQRRQKIWSEYSIVNKEYFDFVLLFMEFFNDRWCHNFYSIVSSNKYTSYHKFKIFIKKLNTILKNKI